jgi:CBS domain-containing protein
MAIAALLARVGVGACFAALARVGFGADPLAFLPKARLWAEVRSWTPVTSIVVWLAWANMALGTFHLAPALPLDGGRVLRSVLWRTTGSFAKATRFSAVSGQVFAGLIACGGAAVVFSGVRVPFLGAGLSAGLWLALFGWFLGSAAFQVLEQVWADHALTGLTVGAMMRHAHTARADWTVRELARRRLVTREAPVLPIVEEGRLLGLVSIDRFRHLPRAIWDRRVHDIMLPANRLVTVEPTLNAVDALRLMMARDSEELPVLEERKYLGIVFRRDLERWVDSHSFRRPVPLAN